MHIIFIIILIVVLIFLALIFIPSILAMISIYFEDLRHKYYLLKKANEMISEANQWKNDVEYYLGKIKKEGPITFQFEESNITYNYTKMNNLLKRINIYLENYDTYVKYVKSNQWYNLLPPNFHQEINPKADNLQDCISNYAEVVKQEKEIRFLKFLHSTRKN